MKVERSPQHKEGINCPEHKTAAVDSGGFFPPLSFCFLNIAPAQRRAKLGRRLPLASRHLRSLIVRRNHNVDAVFPTAHPGFSFHPAGREKQQRGATILKSDGARLSSSAARLAKVTVDNVAV